MKGKTVSKEKNCTYFSHSPQLKFSIEGSLEDSEEPLLISHVEIVSKTVRRLGHRHRTNIQKHQSNCCLSSTQQSLVTFSKTPALIHERVTIYIF